MNRNTRDDIKIDLVYLWVDNQDKHWQELKNKYINNDVPEGAKDDCRYRNLDELKYSLRSAEQYAPWLNHIYIVTANQTPEWLNVNNPKISIINHKDIMPSDALPTFNSIAIETCIPNIPNLSEYFLYANDDMFFMDDATPDFFYAKDGYPIFRFIKWRLTDNELYMKITANAHSLIYKKFKKKYPYLLHHNIDAYRKTDFINCNHVYANEVKQVLYSKFRNEENFERGLYNWYACAIGHGHIKRVSKIDQYLPLHKKVWNFIFKIYRKDSLILHHESLQILERVEKLKPKLLCINDSLHSTEKARKDTKDILNILFPNKSSFEK